MRVLLISDSPANATRIRMMLRRECFLCDAFNTEGLRKSATTFEHYDFIVINLAKLNLGAIDALKRLRELLPHISVLLISGSEETNRAIEYFGFVPDDCICEPSHRRKLTRKIMEIVERRRGQTCDIVRTGKLVVHLQSRRAEVDGMLVRLTDMEFGVLEILCRLKGTALPKGMILGHLYSGTEDPGLKILDVFVCKLRKKIAEATGGEHYIETTNRCSYILRDPMALQPSAAA